MFDFGAYNLPIVDVLDEIKSHLLARDELVLRAPPGAGKTTCVPLALLDQPWLAGKKILVLEPRRLAARSAAHRMASMLNESPGETVGYRMRLDTRVGKNTRIEVITEGILTRMLLSDPSLEDVGLVIFDEFHERHLDSDLALALTLKGRELFRDADAPLKLLVMSATIETAGLSRLINDAPVVVSEGRTYPVEVSYGRAAGNSRRENIVDKLVSIIQTAVKENPHSSLLVFLPGQGEIHRCETALKQWLSESGLSTVAIMPLFGNLSMAEQQLAIAPIKPDSDIHQKVVLATNIAETSLTIDGIDVVVDSGLVRSPVFDPATAMMRLETTRISAASSIQRMGRAGRLRPGRCYRLWSADQQKQLQQFTPAEILNGDLMALALQILSWGVNDPDELSWLDSPPRGAWLQAIDMLRRLGAIEGEAESLRLSVRGEVMTRLPVHPRLAQILIAGAEIGQAELASLLAGLLSERDPIAQSKQDYNVEVDYRIELLSGRTSCPGHYKGWLGRVKQLSKQYERQLRANTKISTSGEMPESSAIGYLLAAGFPDRIARRRHKGGYQLANGRSAAFNERSRLEQSPWLVLAEVSGMAGGKGDVIRSAASFDKSLLDSHLAHMLEHQTVTELDKQSGQFIAERRVQLGALLVRREPLPSVPETVKNQALLTYIRETGLKCLSWPEGLKHWLNRVRWVGRAQQVDPLQESWPDLGDGALMAGLEHWLLPYLNDIKGIKSLGKLDLRSILQARLSWEQSQVLERLAPEKYKVPSGSNITIDYQSDPPVLAVKLQEMFGAVSTPSILDGNVKLTLHLLSPARRPLQVTADLAAFWQSAYIEVKKEMKGRYPKHPWPDDPLQALPTSRVKRLAGKPPAKKDGDA